VFDSGQLAGFLAAVAVLVIVPGPNTILILAHGASGGRPAGLATVLGVETGTLIHTGAAALGLSAVLSTSALAFDLLKYAGAAYLALLGLRALRGHGTSLARVSGGRLRLSQAYWRAALTNILNPKVAVFFLALLPQFVHPERGHLVLQFVVLGLMVSGVGLCFGSLLALAAGTLSAWLRRDAVARWQGRLTGTVLLALGVRLAWGPE
jgi:threonine/homoserine/homoserine lactone efflux protein